MRTAGHTRSREIISHRLAGALGPWSVVACASSNSGNVVRFRATQYTLNRSDLDTAEYLRVFSFISNDYYELGDSCCVVVYKTLRTTGAS